MYGTYAHSKLTEERERRREKKREKEKMFANVHNKM
jgi:hypothetical protein